MVGDMGVDLNMPVLVVDDFQTMVRIVRNQLTSFGFTNVLHAPDGAEALKTMREHQVGLVISDWNMEPMSGYDLLCQVRADDQLTATPFLLITGESKTEKVVAAQRAGVNGYIVKPFNAATLKAKIESVLGRLPEAAGREPYMPLVLPRP
jgi:two-component system chemotaxis response regulator CheY